MITRLLYKISGWLPCRLIHRKPGEPYLERYWLFSLFGITAYLHRFVAADIDEGPHDHPWPYALSLILTGGYTEDRGHIHPKKGFAGREQQLKPWRINLIRGHDFHRIKRAQPETWTLFIHTRSCQPWGFIATTTDGARYHQPFNTATQGWHIHAPTGNQAGREPFTDTKK